MRVDDRLVRQVAKRGKRIALRADEQLRVLHGPNDRVLHEVVDLDLRPQGDAELMVDVRRQLPASRLGELGDGLDVAGP